MIRPTIHTVQTVILITVALFFAGEAFAQRASVRGLVKDAETGDLLVGATVMLDDFEGERRGTATTRDGFFAFNRILSGRYVLYVSYVGFGTWSDTLQVGLGEDVFIEINLALSDSEMHEIVVESVRAEVGRFIAGLETIHPSDLARVPMPDVTYDLAGYLLTLPGFVSTGDRGGQLFVRGGTPTQNLVLLDGIPIYQPFHIVGFYSAFPAEIISYTDVYAGGFGAQYGGRISSVIDIATKNGNKKRIQASGSIAPFLSGFRIEVPVVENDVSLLVSFRESVIERLAPELLGEELPFRFGDLFAKFHAFLTSMSTVSFTLLRTFDEGNVLAKGTADEMGNRNSSWNNYAYGVQYLYMPPDYPAMFEFASHVTHMDSEFRLTEEEFRESEVDGFTLKMRYHYLLGDTQIHAGIFGNLNRFTYRLSHSQKPINAAVTSGGGFVDMRFIIADRLRIEPGVRVESFSHGLKMSVGPRIRATLQPAGNLSKHQFSVAWGRYFQQIVGLNNEQDVSDVFTIWAAVPKGSPVPEATHIIGGWKGRVFPWLELTVEGYRKWLKNLAFPVFTEDVVGKTSFGQVSGDAKGLDFKTEVNLPAFYAGVSYSLAEVKYERTMGNQRRILIPGVQTVLQFDSSDFHPPHDRRHQINAMAQFEFGKNKLSVRWQFGSGLPFTQVNGYYRRLDPESLPESDGLTQPGETFVSRSTLYGGRLPPYHRFDISFERRFTFDRIDVTLQVGVINVYDRSNIFAYNIFSGDRVDQLPLIPSVGIRVDVR